MLIFRGIIVKVPEKITLYNSVGKLLLLATCQVVLVNLLSFQREKPLPFSFGAEVSKNFQWAN